MSKRFMDLNQTVGYDYGEKKLIVTMSKKTADKMRSDGWATHYDEGIGHFVVITLKE